MVPFAAQGGELMLVVGTSKDTFMTPRSCTTGYLRTYKIINDGQDLELLHKVRSADALFVYLLKGFVDGDKRRASGCSGLPGSTGRRCW